MSGPVPRWLALPFSFWIFCWLFSLVLMKFDTVLLLAYLRLCGWHRCCIGGL